MIDVLLATYRPDEAMLKEQVDSIRSQRDVEVNLIQREDVDGLGARRNFSELLAVSRAEYAAFSDQDDVWDENKLAKCLTKMHELESFYGTDIPLLVFCDGYVTDADLNRKQGTVLSRQKIDVEKGLAVNRLLMQNFVAGNSMLFNAALREKVGRIPERALMHDAWLVLVAAAFGHIGFVDEPLYHYRQHGGNVLGATNSGFRHFRNRISDGVGAFRTRLTLNVEQAAAFIERFGDESAECAHAFAAFLKCNWVDRRRRIFRYQLYKHGWIRNLALILFA